MPRKYPLIAACSGCHDTRIIKVKYLCNSCYGKLHYLNNKERHNATGKAYYASHPEVFKARYERVKNDPNTPAKRKRARERNIEKARQAVRNHYKNNKSYYSARSNRRDKHIAHQYKTLPEAHKRLIRDFYANCPPGHHVDHIVPIRHPDVSGLHVIWNLQYLPALENIRKGNKFENP